MKYIRILSILSTLIFAGCASNPMQVSSSQSVQKAMPDESQIVFMRSSFVGSAINASLYDVTDEETKFLGIISNGTKVAHTTTPGKHTFMVVSEAADFMEADFLPSVISLKSDLRSMSKNFLTQQLPTSSSILFL